MVLGESSFQILPRSPRWGPLLIGSANVQHWVKKVTMNAEATVTKFDNYKLARYGGHIEVTKHYACVKWDM